MLSEGERVAEILSYNGNIWWRHVESSFYYVGNRLAVKNLLMSPDEWAEMIHANRDLLKVVPAGDRIVDGESFSRFDLQSKSAEVSAQVQRILFEKFIVCDDELYAAGGIPLYALWRHPRFNQVEVVSSGANRRAVHFEPLNAHPGFFARPETQEAFSEGRFWNSETPIPFELQGSQKAFAEIQVVDRTLVPANLLEQTQIDALFRVAMRSLDWLIFHTALPGGRPAFWDQDRPERRLFKARVRQAFQDAIPPSPDDSVIDTNRMEALRVLFVGERQVPKKHLRFVEALENSFRTLNERNPPEAFAPEDLAALERL
jgi:hypothetical protein